MTLREALNHSANQEILDHEAIIREVAAEIKAQGLTGAENFREEGENALRNGEHEVPLREHHARVLRTLGWRINKKEYWFERDTYDPFQTEKAPIKTVYGLKDTNNNYYNCGHYPEMEVVAITDHEAYEGEMGERYAHYKPLFQTKAEAEKAAAKINSSSSSSWLSFQNT